MIDVAPTVLEVAGLPEPMIVNSGQPAPMEGVSMAYSFDDAKAVERHELQYFEMFCNRGIYHKGWSAVTRHKGNSQLLFSGMGRLSENSVLVMKNKSFSLTAELEVPSKGSEGVIIHQGGMLGGMSLYAKGGKAKFDTPLRPEVKTIPSRDILSRFGFNPREVLCQLALWIWQIDT